MTHSHTVRDLRPRPPLSILPQSSEATEAQARKANSMREKKAGTDYTAAVLMILRKAQAPMTRTAIGIKLNIAVYLLRPDMTRLLNAGTITEARTGRGRERVVYSMTTDALSPTETLGT